MIVVIVASATAGGAPSHFLVTNDDQGTVFPPSTLSFYPIAPDGSLAAPAHVSTGGNGVAGGFFGANRLLIAPNGPDECLYASNAQSENVSGIDIHTHKLAGPVRGSVPDHKLARNGIALAVSATHLYAAFSGSGNIGVFERQPACALKFIADFPAKGLAGGFAESLAIHGNMMIAAYGDGSIESFDVSAGMPRSNGDAQNSTRAQDDYFPDSIDITSDGHYAIFGSGSADAAVQVSDISSGKLTPTLVYTLGTAWNSSSVRLSPDERVLYISNNSAGRVTAAFFDKNTGKVRQGCTSAPLKGYYEQFTYLGAVATGLSTGTGGLLYVPEFNAQKKSYLGVLRFIATPTGCTLTEIAHSPFAGVPGSALLSIAVYPPRPF